MLNSILSVLLLITLFGCGNNNEVDENPSISGQNPKQGFTVTTLNIKWFGNGGTKDGDSSDEYRDQELKNFLASYLADTKVFVFQEITDPVRLAKLIPHFQCGTYQRSMDNHQYVVVCVLETLPTTFSTIHAVDLGNKGLRPAQMAEITFDNGQKLQIIGVHLKGFREDTRTRLDQINKLVESPIISGDAQEPGIIIGDFNTYPNFKTGWRYDDDDIIQFALDDHNFNQIGDGHNSYLGKNAFRQFDRAWARKLRILSSRASGPCATRFAAPYDNIGYYKKAISDHCPVSFTVLP